MLLHIRFLGEGETAHSALEGSQLQMDAVDMVSDVGDTSVNHFTAVLTGVSPVCTCK